ncbi:amidohydrolase family protein [Pseudoalteromonas citrea]|uniref:amidohydrolase family protein n=1 Tax=Pseudoalteromonas citrea TaxID=43655 RepID=UPI002016327F|nr:amidohydrolase family protein [Pseudoalteromonas citrea]
MYVLRKGVPQSEFATLRKLQKEQEQTYLEDLSASLTHTHQSLLIKDVAVLDVEQGVVTSGQHVLLRDGKIKRISNEPLKLNGIATVNGSGKTLIPGLWDMHGHLSKENGILNIANGVTSVRDMGNEHKNIMEIESLFDTNRVLGTRVYRAGFMDKLSENSAGLSVETLEEALNTVDFFADNGYVQIKLYSSIDPTWVKPIADRAHNRGLRLSGHVPAFMTAEQAINAGYDEIQHINMLFLNFLAGQDVDTRTTKRFSLIGEQATELPLDTDEMTAFIKLLADKKIVVDATVSTFRSLLMAENEKVNPEYAHLIDHMPVSFVRQMKGAVMHVEDIHKINYQRSGEAMQNMLKKLYDAGVNIVPGTDNVAGFTLIRELELYALAGIPTAEVIKMATINSAKLMGVAHKTGSIDENKTADLVLVEGDPLEEIKALRKPSLIIKGEQVFKPEQIYNAIGVKPFVPASDITH